jgi:hypothetical protein
VVVIGIALPPVAVDGASCSSYSSDFYSSNSSLSFPSPFPSSSSGVITSATAACVGLQRDVLHTSVQLLLPQGAQAQKIRCSESLLLKAGSAPAKRVSYNLFQYVSSE